MTDSEAKAAAVKRWGKDVDAVKAFLTALGPYQVGMRGGLLNLLKVYGSGASWEAAFAAATAKGY
jgi:hypothetical protein